MKLEKKKMLVSKTLGVGKDRIIFNSERLPEIKEAITRQDIRDLVANKSIVIREIKGRMKKQKRNTRRRAGSIKKRVKTSKRDYMYLTRKLRNHLFELRKQERVTDEVYQKTRKEIRAGVYRSKGHLNEHLSGTKK